MTMQKAVVDEFPVLPELPDEKGNGYAECNMHFFFNKLQSPWQNLFIDVRDSDKFNHCHPRYTINIPIQSEVQNIYSVLKKDIVAQQNMITFIYIYTDINNQQTTKHCDVINTILKDKFSLFPQMFVFNDKNGLFLQKYAFLCLLSKSNDNKEEDKEDKEEEDPKMQKYRELLLSIARPKKNSFLELYSLRIGYHLEYPDQIIKDRLFLGDYNAATRKVVMKNLGITHIVNCTQGDNEFEKDKELNIKYFQIPITDSYWERIILFFDDVIAFMDNAMKEKQNNKIFVHCRAGVSRSSTIVIVYLMKTHSMSMDAALQYVQERRSCIHPNDGFRIQLAHYQKNGYKIDETSLNNELANATDHLF